MTLADVPAYSSDPLDHLDIEGILAAAAAQRPEAFFGRDSTGTSWTLGTLDGRVSALAAAFGEYGLASGECLLVCATPRLSTLAAILAALRARLHVALAPPQLDVETLAGFAARAGVTAAVTGSPYANFEPVERMMAIALGCPDIRLIGALDGDCGSDGAVDLSHLEPCPVSGVATPAPPSRIVTYVPGGALRHSQRTLVIAALDILTRSCIQMGDCVVSTIAPASFAGFVLPLMPLLGDTSLTLHGPFDTGQLLEDVRRQPRTSLVVPRALAGPIEEAGLLADDHLASLMLLHRASSAEPTAMPVGTGRVPVIDLTAFGETCVVAEMRDEAGRPLIPCASPHTIEIDGRRLTVLRRSSGGALRFEGDAVTPV